MPAYYNEHDPNAAAWLRELIHAGHIASGDVDERDIRDVRPDELARYTQCHFFGGVGVWSYALRLAGWPDDMPVWTGSCPCQPFSQAGKGKGVADERHLWPAWFHLIEQCRPITVFGEQVAANDGLSWLDIVRSDLEGASYTVGCADLCAAGVGAPHIRQRLFFVADTDGGHAGPDGLQRCRQHGQLKEDCVVGKLANNLSGGRTKFRASRIHDQRPSRNDSARCSKTRKLADSGRKRREADVGAICRERVAAQGSDEHACGSSTPGRLGDTNGGGVGQHARKLSDREEEHDQRCPNSGHPSISAGSAGSMADAECDGGRPDEPQRESHQRVADGRHPAGFFADEKPGPTNGFWRDADWLWCRDSRWRPVEPGSFPLAHGLAERVGRLRGYGNAINAEVAAAFVRAYLAR